MIDFFHSQYAPWKKPRTYRRIARKEYLELAKSKKRSAKKIRSVIRKQLGYVRRDLGYLEAYMSEGYALDKKFINNYLVILQLYEQQMVAAVIFKSTLYEQSLSIVSFIRVSFS